MQFSAPRHRRAPEPVVPMINVVFLLLVFFLISAQITPPAPFELTLAETAEGDRAAPADTLYMDAGARLAFNDARGDAVMDALAARATADTPLQIRADAGMEARALARLLPALAARGIDEVEIVTRAK